MKLIFVFIDGVGIGERDGNSNPIYASRTKFLASLMEKARFHADASLGIAGLPQSATGQTAIFTGVNAPEALNRHMSGQPTITLKKIIHKVNMFGELQKMGLKATSANVYRNEYLNNMLDVKDRRNRPSVTSVMGMAANAKFRTVEEFIKGNGVYHDITGDKLKESGYPVDAITPQEAARILYKLSRQNDFTLFEHFMTDIKGHQADMEEAVKIIDLLDAFLQELISQIDFDEDVLMITSDHGNIEDINTHTHTFNKVPVVVLGKKADSLDMSITSLIDIMPFVLELFKRENGIEN